MDIKTRGILAFTTCLLALSALAQSKGPGAAPKLPEQKQAQAKAAAHEKLALTQKLDSSKKALEVAEKSEKKAAAELGALVKKHEKTLQPHLPLIPAAPKSSADDISKEMALAEFLISPKFTQSAAKENPVVINEVKAAAGKLKAESAKKKKTKGEVDVIVGDLKERATAYDGVYGAGEWALLPNP